MVGFCSKKCSKPSFLCLGRRLGSRANLEGRDIGGKGGLRALSLEAQSCWEKSECRCL